MEYSRGRINKKSATIRRKPGVMQPANWSAKIEIRRLIGNAIRPKLAVGAANDASEQEADNVSEQVMRMPEPALQREADDRPAPEEEKTEQLQAKAEAGGAFAAPAGVESGIDALRGGGEPLSQSSRRFFEPRFGAGFGRVRVHTDTRANRLARSINARAFTHGRDIVFGSGQYAPGSHDGKKLLAHELTHVVQQRGGIQRKIELANDKLLTKGSYGAGDVNKFYKKIAGNHTNLEGLIEGKGKVYAGIGGSDDKAYRKKLVKDILGGLLDASTTFFYANESEVFDDVYKRAVSSLYMRASQGTSKIKKVRYPGSVGAQTNKKASAYWKLTTGGTYKFELNSAGKNNAYEALRTILFEASSKVDTTRMHCDYVIAAIHFMAMAEDMGIPTFDAEVKKGNIKVWLQAPKSFDPTVPDSMAVWGDYASKTSYDPKKKSIGKVLISGESEIVVGDHLMFYNHSAYNAMNSTQGESWRLENAFVTDKEASGNKFRFQGHGYFSPKSRDTFITAMRSKFNTLYERANNLVSAGKTGKLASDFPFVKLKSGVASSKSASDHEIVYSKKGEDKDSWNGWSDIPSGDRLTMTLRKVSASDYPNPFTGWGKDKEAKAEGTASLWVRRPVEGFKD
jgi:hypothetical protein